MKCPNCNKNLIIPDRAYLNLETYKVGGSVVVASECCSTGFIVKMNVSYKTTLYTGNETEDDWGIDLNRELVAEKHYEQSRQHYKDLAEEGAESHLAYYREKFPENYKLLTKN